MADRKVNDTVLEFINSRDVRDYLCKRGYEFKPLEAAWIIGRSVFRTVGEKHEAYRLLKESFEDFILPELLFIDGAETSFHEFLTELAEWEDQTITRFLPAEGGGIYSYKYKSKNNVSYFGERECSGFFTSFEKALKNAQESWTEDEVESFCFMKYDADSDWPSIEVETDYAGNVIDVTEFGENVRGIKYDLDQIYYEIPVPFKRGDVLCRYDQHGGHWYHGSFGPVVVEGVNERWSEDYCDSSDMVVNGMMQIEETGHVYHEVCSHNFIDLEYYRGEFTGVRRILKAVSSFLKDEIPLDLFANAYAKIIMEENAKGVNPAWYPDEYLKKAGLTEENE